MASIVKPAIARYLCLANAPTRSTSMKLPTSASSINRQASSAISRVVNRQAHTIRILPAATRICAFHTTSRRPILAPLPQVVQGTANDPAPVPAPSPSHGSYHWTFERLISAALVPLTIAPFAAGSLNPTTDALLCATLLIHSHIGFQSVIIDYIPNKRLPRTRVLFWWGLRAATLTVAVGLYEFETNDVGLTEAIKRIWTA